MISGNAPSNPLSAYQAPANNISGSANPLVFGHRAVGQNPNVAAAADNYLQQIINDDPGRAVALEDVAQDGGTAAFKQLLDRLNIHQTQPHDGNRERRSAADASQQQFTPVPFAQNENMDIPLTPANLTSDGQFARIGDSKPGRLKQRNLPDGETTYRFVYNHKANRQPSSEKDVELTNCFRTSARGSVNNKYNPQIQELRRLTNASDNACAGRGEYSYTGEMDIHVRVMDSANSGEATIFRFIPHHEVAYKNENNEFFTLPHDSAISEYKRLIENGNVFNQRGKPPLTINVERHDGKDYLTIKARCNYVRFTESDNHCDIPFRGADTPVNQATCCTDGRLQREDVKYLYKAPLPNGWFNVKFHTAFSQFVRGEERDTGNPDTLVLINDNTVVRSYARLGNNDCNYDDEYGASAACGYHVQFGISDASMSMAVRIKNPDLKHAQYGQQRSFPKSDFLLSKALLATPAKVVGECQAPSSVPG